MYMFYVCVFVCVYVCAFKRDKKYWINTNKSKLSATLLFGVCVIPHNGLQMLTIKIYRVIENYCRGFNNLSHTVHLR